MALASLLERVSEAFLGIWLSERICTLKMAQSGARNNKIFSLWLTKKTSVADIAFYTAHLSTCGGLCEKITPFFSFVFNYLSSCGRLRSCKLE
ncbi:hypothetical protein EBU99_08765 [bacterium]|nr:hypothetical protein [bacterium]